MFENKEEIVLDATNNVIVGPNGYFKIVIDEFDGTKVTAWHMEGPDGSKSSDLAIPAINDGTNIDLLANTGNGTVSGLFSGMATRRLMFYLPDVPHDVLYPPPPEAK